MSDLVEVVLKASDQASAIVDKNAASWGNLDSSLKAAQGTALAASKAMGDSFAQAGAAIAGAGNALGNVFGKDATAGVQQITTTTASVLGMAGSFRILAPTITAVKAAVSFLGGPLGWVAAGFSAVVAGVQWLLHDTSVPAVTKAFGDMSAAVKASADAEEAVAKHSAEVAGQLAAFANSASTSSKGLLGNFESIAEGLKEAGLPEIVSKANLAIIDKWHLLGDELGKSKVVQQTNYEGMVSNVEVFAKTTQERLDNLSPALKEATLNAVNNIRNQLHLGVDRLLEDMANGKSMDRVVEDAWLAANVQTTQTVQKTVDTMVLILQSAAAPMLQASSALGASMFNGINPYLQQLLPPLQSFLDAVNAAGGGGAGGGSSTTVTGSVGSGGGSPGGLVPPGIGSTSSPIPPSPGGSGQSNAMYGGGKGGAGVGGVTNYGQFIVQFPNASNANELLHGLDVAGGQ